MTLVIRRALAIGVVLSVGVGVSAATAASAADLDSAVVSSRKVPTPPSTVETSGARLSPDDRYGFLTEAQVRDMLANGKYSNPPIGSRTTTSEDDVTAPLAPTSAARAAASGADRAAQSSPVGTGTANGVSYSVNGTIYAIGEGSGSALPGGVTDVALGGDGTRAIVEYSDPMWFDMVFGGAPWRATSIGFKNVSTGAFAPLSADAEGRRVPATLRATSANGRWVVYTGPDMDKPYADPANLGVVYVMDVDSGHVTEMPISSFGSTEEHPFIPTITSITNDGTRFAWGSCVADVGGSTCAAEVPGGAARISADGSTVGYQDTDGRLYRTGAGGGAGTLVSVDENGHPLGLPLLFDSWVLSDDGSVFAGSTGEPSEYWEATSSYVWADGSVNHFLDWAYDTWVTAISGDGSLITYSHPYGADASGFETRAASGWNRLTGEGFNYAIGADNLPLPATETNYVLGVSTDGRRVALMDYQKHFPYVYDATGAPPSTLMQKVPGTNAWGWNYDAWAADPVNTRTGAVELSATDATLPSRGGAATLTRSYSSDLSRTGRFGPGWVDSFGSNIAFPAGDKATVLTPDGSVVDFTKSGDAWTTGAAVRAQLEQDGTGWLLTASDGSAYTYDANGRLTGSLSRDGAGWQVIWDGDTQTVTTTAGTTMTLVERGGLLRSVTLPGGEQTSYAYTGGRLTSVTDASGAVTRYDYDSDGRMTTLTNAAAHEQFTNTYGTDGRVQTQADATGDVMTFAWDADQQVAYVWGPDDAEWIYAYRGPVLVWSESPDGQDTFYVYDSALNVVSKTDGNATDKFTYDAAGNPVQAQWSDGSSMQLQYDPTGLPLSITDANGGNTSYVYDSRGHLTESHLPDGRIARNAWDPATGDQTSSTSPAGLVTHYEHNSAGQTTAVTTPEGRRTTFSYDQLGRLSGYVTPHAATANPADYTWTATYSADGLTATLVDPTGHARTVASNALGQTTSVKDARDNSVGYSYDSNDQLSEVVDSAGGQTSYTYDQYGWMASRQDQNGNVQQYQHDALGRVTSLRQPDAFPWSYSYTNGNLSQIQDPNGASNYTTGTTYLSYDQMHRLLFAMPQTPSDGGPPASRANNVVEKSDTIDGPYLPSAAVTANVERDLSGRVTALGVWDPDLGGEVDSVAYTRDATGRPITVVRHGHTISYQWDADDRITSIVDADGATTTRTYTDDGLLASVTVNGATVNYEYDDAGNLTLATYPDGTSEHKTYDLLGRLTDNTVRNGDTVLATQTYEYDPNGNPVHVVADGVEHYAAYDAKNQLTDWCEQSPCTPTSAGTHYTYDPVGNRLTESHDGQTTNYTYDSDDRLTTITAPDGTERDEIYDLAGRLIGDNDRHYQYDVLGRLTAVTDPAAGNISYTYTADGLLDTRTADGVTSHFQWDTTSGAPRLLSESGSGESTTYAYGTGLLQTAAGTDVSWVHTDSLGSVTTFTAAGQTTGSVTYEPFGTTSSSDLAADDTTRPLFAGTPTDPATGLLLMGERVYDTTTGRFLTFDPQASADRDPAVSTYVYVENRPGVLVDPTGRHGAVTGSCAAWLCTLYSVSEISNKASSALSLATAGLALFPPTVEAAPIAKGASAMAGSLGTVSDGIITMHAFVTGGDWQCEGQNVFDDIALATLGARVSDLAAGAIGRTWSREDKETLSLVVSGGFDGGGGAADGIIGAHCKRPGS